VSTLRFVSFLGHAARPHYEAVSAQVAASVGLTALTLAEPGMEGLEQELGMPGPTVAYLCGCPYVRARAAGYPVKALAAPVSQGSTRPEYASVLVTRPGLDASGARDLSGCRIGVNGRDSFSGWILPRSVLAERGLRDAVFTHVVETGSHRETLRLLLAGEIDAGPIDSTILALEARADPAVAALPIVERLGSATSPPVVLLGGDPELAAGLRRALVALSRDAAGRNALDLGLVERYAPVEDSDYDTIRSTPGVLEGVRD
jgi:phosphonate transport system substrate-binding protein